MTEEQKPDVQSDGAQGFMRPEKIYLKDVSFESPFTPDIFRSQVEPDLGFEIDSFSEKIQEDTYEVVLKATVALTADDQTKLLVEIHQAGIFLLKGFDDKRLHRALNVYCLRTLYPYACAAISDLVTKGGFPQLLLQPVDFVALYNHRLSQQAAATAEE